MNASIKTIERSLATRVTARRVANWSVLMVALGQFGCDDDPEPWAIADGGADASVTADGGGELTSASAVSETADAAIDTLTAEVPNGSGGTAVDAGVSSGPILTPDASDSSAVSSAATTSETSSGVVATETSAPHSSTTEETSTGTSASEPETSAPTTDETSDAETSSELPVVPTDGGVDAGPPALEVCGSVIDEAQGISLAQALENYPIADAGAGDGGATLDDCYPPCIAALLHACPAAQSSECTISYGDDSNTACWENGAAQTQQYQFGESLVLTDALYLGSAPCISGVMTYNYETENTTYVWYDGTGAQVATGTDESTELVVTCTDTSEAHSVDRYACPWLGQVIYTPSYCSFDE